MTTYSDIGTEGLCSMDNTLERLNEVFREVFDNEDLSVTPATTAKDIEGWDSLMHVTLVVNVEKAFGVRFSSSEVASLKNVGELIQLIERHRAKK
jgi:acyl carrier protein